MTLNYSINGTLFSQYGLHVAASEGLLDGLELKEPLSVNWPDAHGEVVDLSRPRYQPRQIKLDCWLYAASVTAFLAQLNALQAQFLKAGTHRLSLFPTTDKPLVYEVYLKSGISVKKQWSEPAMFGEFTLNLVEPQPVKWVLKGTAGSPASITLSASSPLKLDWGDGSSDELEGSGQTLTHTYGGTTGSVYYLIISGELERMTLLSKTNLTEVWPR